VTPDAATAKAWTVLYGKIVLDRAHYDWFAKHPSCQNPGDTLRHTGRVAVYGDLLDGMDRIVRTFGLSPVDGWAEFRADVKRDRDFYYEQAADYAGTPGGDAQSERAYGRVDAYSEVLAYMTSAEKEAQR
jgi:hypothetical protein